MSSYVIVQALLDTHAYGGCSPGQLQIGGGPSDAKRKPAHEWIREVAELYHLAGSEFLDGRRVIFGLALIEKQLFATLASERFLEPLQEEIAQQSGLQLAPKGKRLLAARRPTRIRIPVLDDAPAEEDELARGILAHVLCGRIRRARGNPVVFGVFAPGERIRRFIAARSFRLRATPSSPARAVLFHVDGRWGAGKTSMLNFIARELRGADVPKADRWVVVTFNAWRYQHVAPPWWWLTTVLQENALRELWSIDRPRAVVVWLWGVWWRIRDGWAVYIVLGASAVGAYFLWRAGFFGDDVKGAGAVTESLVKIAAFVALSWGAIKGLNRWLMSGTSGTGASVLERSHDPLRLVRRRFKRVVRSIRHPVVIFIDDLDRCQQTYIVELLEGIQTLFINEPVVYVVAADGRWLSRAYAGLYDDSNGTVGEPGRPLGALFLEKAFQHTIRLARIPDDVRERYWKGLLGENADSGASPEAHKQAQQLFESLTSAGDILDTLRAHESREEIDRRALRLAAARALETKAVEADMQSMLDRFSGLLEDNPRAMKKLVNAYGIEVETRLPDLSGDDQVLRQLALWTIVSLRWPLLAEHLAAFPAHVALGPEDAIPAEFPTELEVLVRSTAVRNVMSAAGVEPPVRLDPAAVSAFVGASAVGVTPVGDNDS